MVDQQDVQKLEEQINKLTQSTKTTVPAFGPAHDWLRRTFPWYYNWHTRPSAVRIHIIVLILALVLMAWYFLRATADLR